MFLGGITGRGSTAHVVAAESFFLGPGGLWPWLPAVMRSGASQALLGAWTSLIRQAKAGTQSSAPLALA